MMRLPTAALLVASFDALAQTQVPNVFEDGKPAKAAEVNENFDALETAIDALPTPPIMASLKQRNWQTPPDFVPPSELFDSVNVSPNGICDSASCEIVVSGVTDHTSCVVQVTGGAVSGDADLNIDLRLGNIFISTIYTWNQGQAVYINISCPP